MPPKAPVPGTKRTGFGEFFALKVEGMKIADRKAVSLTENLGSDDEARGYIVLGGGAFPFVKELIP